MNDNLNFTEEGTIFRIKIRGTMLQLHKTSNMFTTNYKQARVYKNYASAVKWIESRMVDNDYNRRFNGIELQIVSCEADSEN